MNNKVKMLAIQFIIPCFLFFFISLSQADVTLTVEKDGSGSRDSSGNAVEVSLDNSVKVKAVQVDVCDVDDYLTCTACDTTDRTTNFICSTNELDGCCRVVLVNTEDSSPLIVEGQGSIFTLKYDVASGAPEGECRNLNPEEVKMTDALSNVLEVTTESGEFCFDESVATTTTTPPTTTTPVITTTTTTTILTSCKVSISPSSATLKSGVSLQFNAETTCDEEEVEGTYSWEIVPESTIGSEIDENGLFTAGDNTTDSDVEETVKVTDIAHENKSATATVTIKKKQTPIGCEVSISPLAATVLPGEMLTLVASNTGVCNTPQYEWSLNKTADDSSIEYEGNTCYYTAGANDGTEPLTDVISVADTVNEIDSEAEITILAGGGVSIKISPDSLYKSHLIPLAYLIFITGEGTHFKVFNTTLTFEPPEAALSLLPLILSETSIWDIILVMPSWLAGEEDQTVTLTVTTEDEMVSGDFYLELLPFILDRSRSLQ